MFDHAQSIQNFVETWAWHNFRLVNTDKTLLEAMQRDVVKLYSSTDTRGRDACIQLFHRLYDAFCPHGAQKR